MAIISIIHMYILKTVGDDFFIFTIKVKYGQDIYNVM